MKIFPTVLRLPLLLLKNYWKVRNWIMVGLLTIAYFFSSANSKSPCYLWYPDEPSYRYYTQSFFFFKWDKYTWIIWKYSNRTLVIWRLKLLIWKCMLLFSHSVVSDSLWLHGQQAHQASLSFTISQGLLKLMSIQSVMPPNHLIFCHPLLFLPSIFPSIRVFPCK